MHIEVNKNYTTILISLPSKASRKSLYFYLHISHHLHIESEDKNLIRNKLRFFGCKTCCKQFLHSGFLLPNKKIKKLE